MNRWKGKIRMIYKAFYLDVAQVRMNGAPSESRTPS